MSETKNQSNLDPILEKKKKVRAQYHENKRITDENYDKVLAVKCKNGTFVGKKKENIIEYRGIPFVGRQPVGELRWKAPVDVVPDDGVYEAYYNAKSAYQTEELTEDASLYYQDEGCLYLNLWRADDTVSEKADAKAAHPAPASALAHPCASKPVMVWIHGGAYERGGTVEPTHDCWNFVKENPDVIVVTIAYRLNIFGFLHLSHLPDGKDYPDAQNLGLMDQMMALKWVHENIAGFGGDPDNVTIFGESAGGGSVTLLPLVEGSHKYFRRVIAESGSPALAGTTEQAIQCTNELMEELGCKTVADLQKMDVEKLVQASSDVLGMRICPERDGSYLPVDPYAAYANGAAKDIDLMQGCNKDEFNYFVYCMGVDTYEEWGKFLLERKLAQLTEEEKAGVLSFCNAVKGESFEYTSRLNDQIWFIVPLFKTAECQIRGGGSTYVYHFTPESTDPIMRCGHAMELTVVFNHQELTDFTDRAFDETFSKTMRKMWVQFAKTGNPSLDADISPDGKEKEWPKYDLDSKEVMIFDEFNIHSEKESERKIVDWDRIYPLAKYYVL